MNRRNAIKFTIPNGWDSLSNTLKSFLEQHSEHASFTWDLPQSNMLWVEHKDIDIVLQNSEFWNYLINSEIIGYDNINIKVYCNTDNPNKTFTSTDNTLFGAYCKNTQELGAYNGYLSDKDYYEKFYIEPELEEI